MTCLNDIRIQGLADGEADPQGAAHAAACGRCGERLRDRRALMASIARALDVPAAMPAPLAREVEESLRLPSTALRPGTAEAARSETTRAGATRLRGKRASFGGSGFRLQADGARRWIFSGLAVAAATLVAVLFLVPSIRRSDATVSASEILARSASQLSKTAASGVEILDYELVLDGVPKEVLPDQVDGTYIVRQAIDRSVPGRFRFASYTQDGRMLTSIAEDPVRKRRVMAFTSEGQPYRFEVTLPQKSNMSLPEMQQLHMQASMALMQASGNQMLETIHGANGTLYRIEVPRVSAPGSNPVWDLHEARVLVDAQDYRIREFAVRGTFLRQAYSLSYRLIAHDVLGGAGQESFEVPHQDGEIVITGEGSTVPSHDVVALALRDLTKLKLAR
jgi:hypothetical protein